MNSRFALHTLLLILVLFSIVQPVSAGPIDTSIEVVSRGIEQFLDYRAEKQFERNFGVSFGNTTDMDAFTPAQKIVYMIAAAEHNPFRVDWVQKTFAHDFVWYYIAMALVSLILAFMSILHKYAPETVCGISSQFVGHESPFDYTVWGKTMALLAILPVIAIPVIEGLMEVEQGISSGMVHNSLEFLNMNSGATGGIFFGEGFAYTSCGSIFAARIQYINQFVANIMKVIFMLAIAWLGSRGFAQILVEWFITALFMRPIVLWYSCKAVEHISTLNTPEGSAGVTQGWSVTADLVGAVAIEMTLVLILSFVTAIVFVFWPVIKFGIKITMGYLIGSLYKVIRVNGALNSMRGKQ